MNVQYLNSLVTAIKFELRTRIHFCSKVFIVAVVFFKVRIIGLTGWGEGSVAWRRK